MDIIDTNLSTADTESLLAVIVSGVEMLAQYDGKGECVKRLMLRGSVMMAWAKGDWAGTRGI